MTADRPEREPRFWNVWRTLALVSFGLSGLILLADGRCLFGESIVCNLTALGDLRARSWRCGHEVQTLQAAAGAPCP